MVLYFSMAIALGAIALDLPASHRGHLSFIDALFTSTSAICVTGLIVVDTATKFTPLGKTIIAILIQMGGLGIITFSSWIFLLAGRGLSFREKSIIEESFAQKRAPNVKSLIKKILAVTFIIEGIGAAVLFLFFLKKGFRPLDSLGLSIFHAISAFCNAGFSLFSDSFMGFRDSAILNLTIVSLIILGGIGFLVILDVFGFIKKRNKLSLHTKIVLTTTLILILSGTISLFLLEKERSFSSFSIKEKLLSALFQSVTARTAGFNTVDLLKLSPSSSFILIALMFIGASPGSCGGGIKTSTVGIMFFSVKSQIMGDPETFAFKRTISRNNVGRALTVFAASSAVVFFSTFLLLNWGVLDTGNNCFLKVVFESVSAFGTVGLSLGITPKLKLFGKIVVMLTMFTGRLGPLTMAYAFRKKAKLARYAFPTERVMVG